MAADWNEPELDTPYVDLLDELKERDLDAAKMFPSDPTNPVTNMIRWIRTTASTGRLREYLAGAWADIVLTVAGGGTGASTAADARTNLGLGTIATQNSNNVSITGGAMDGVPLDASDLNSGTVPLARLADITNAEIAAAAAIAWTKINKAGSSLADLATKSAGDLSSGTLPAARLPAGSILQAIFASTSANPSTAGAYADTSLTASITPSNVANKVLVIVAQNGLKGSLSGTVASSKLVRDATDLVEFLVSRTGEDYIDNFVIYLDSPASVAALTYKTQMRNTGTGSVTANSTSTSFIALLEIAG